MFSNYPQLELNPNTIELEHRKSFATNLFVNAKINPCMSFALKEFMVDDHLLFK